MREEFQKMKSMTYKPTTEIEYLDKGSYSGIDYIIVSYGTHPCAYIRVPDTSKFYNIERSDAPEELQDSVHGGLTWAGPLSVRLNEPGFYLGWDYAHIDDFSGFDLNFPADLQAGGKKWTTEEIFNDVKAIIDVLIKLEAA